MEVIIMRGLSVVTGDVDLEVRRHSSDDMVGVHWKSSLPHWYLVITK